MWTVLGKLVLRSHLAMQAFLAVAAAWVMKNQRAALVLIGGMLVVAVVIMRLPDPEPEPVPPPHSMYEEQVKRATAYADSVTKTLAKRDEQVGRLKRQVAELRAQVPDPEVTDSLRAEVDSMFAVLSDSVKTAYRIIPAQQVVIVRQDSTIQLQTVVIAKQDTALVTQDTTISDLRRSRDSLLAANLLRPPPPKPVKLFGIFPAPSRKGSAVLGALGGTVLTVWLIGRVAGANPM